ncbi:uncharacterized protein N7511_008281 [Penicillium nucicola]|uniref:uncharacterized protein n=1 Tax=Penicillium nucicola TaxID=1850975 RepID=UPI002544F5FD|nr:uncharacterized protein N7511_008281 [Penicillium nucicola]KAJ5754128.1 hypothetical protein N7511_008281 [Penicillium nucicola]
MQYLTILISALSVGASATVIPPARSQAILSATPTSSPTSTSPTAYANPWPTGDIHDPNSYTKYAKIEKDARPGIMECYASIQLNDTQCEDSRSTRIGRYDPQLETCEPDSPSWTTAQEKPQVGMVCDNYHLSYYFYPHIWNGLESESGQLVLTKHGEDINQGQSMPVGLKPGCWAGFQDGAWYGNCDADFVVEDWTMQEVKK